MKLVGETWVLAERSPMRNQYPLAERASSDPSASLPPGAIAVQPPAGSTTGSLKASIVSPLISPICATTSVPFSSSRAARSTKSTQVPGSAGNAATVSEASRLHPPTPLSALRTNGGCPTIAVEITQCTLPVASEMRSGSGKTGGPSRPRARSCAPNGG